MPVTIRFRSVLERKCVRRRFFSVHPLKRGRLFILTPIMVGRGLLLIVVGLLASLASYQARQGVVELLDVQARKLASIVETVSSGRE